METIEKLLSEMTREEKVAMCAGSGPWHSTGIERLGIPALKVTDGPNGARGDLESGCSAACFPAGSAIAATWNLPLVAELGEALAEEAKSKGAQVLLGPTVNIHRHPLGGRHFECYSEDPYLTARLAVAYVGAVQGAGVGTCIKHFVCNDSEFERFTISSRVADRPLREIYLLPFECAVREAGAWSMMSAYNRINGVYASSHHDLLTRVLKEEWGFDGVVISDWGAARETVANAKGGLDLEMPGPPRVMGKKLLAALESGEVSEDLVDDKVRRLLQLLIRTGRMDQPEEQPERAEDRPEHRKLARRVACESMVLVKNDAVLPLDASRLRRIAVIGPNAAFGRIQGGGSSIVKPHYEIHPIAALRERLGGGVELVEEVGCFTDKYAPAIDPQCLRPASGETEQGLTVEYRNGEGFGGEPILRRDVAGSLAVWMASPGEGIDLQRFSARYSGIYTPAESGPHSFGLLSAGLSRLYLDDALLIDNWTSQASGDAFFGYGSEERRASVDLEAGEEYALRIEYQRDERGGAGALQFGVIPPDRQDRLDEAAALAANADVAIVVVGTNGEWESEGHDRKGMALPGRQSELIKRVSAVNEKTVVVLNAGSPMELDWLQDVPALLHVWFPGQEYGHALADVLFGDVNPSGRLPTTWAVRLEDTPAYTHYPGENGAVDYGEGLFVGYRWYDARKIEPRLPFGHGLSYTRFDFAALSLPERLERGETLELSCELTNVGERAGQEVVQLYLRDPQSRLVRPEKELRGFEKVALEPGESKIVHFRLDERALAYWDPAAAPREAGGLPGNWVAEAGEFEVLIGASSRDIRLRGSFELAD